MLGRKKSFGISADSAAVSCLHCLLFCSLKNTVFLCRSRMLSSLWGCKQARECMKCITAISCSFFPTLFSLSIPAFISPADPALSLLPIICDSTWGAFISIHLFISSPICRQLSQHISALSQGSWRELGHMQKTEKYDRQPSCSVAMPPRQLVQWPAPLFSTISLQFGKLDSHPHRQVFGFLSTFADVAAFFFSLPAGPQRLYAQKGKKTEPPTSLKEADWQRTRPSIISSMWKHRQKHQLRFYKRK